MGPAFSAFIHAVEADKDVLLFCVRNAWTIIADDDITGVLFLQHRQSDSTAIRHIAGCVVQQNGKDLPYPVRITATDDRCILRDMDSTFYVFGQ